MLEKIKLPHLRRDNFLFKKSKKVLITSGGTREYIDDVRVLTNISSGKLGAQIANTFSLYSKFEKIFYLCSKGSALPELCDTVEVLYANSAQEAKDAMEAIVPDVDVVIHAMAVSDFGFKPLSTKLKSNDPQAFIDSLRDRITVNPKIISFIKKWNPSVKLVSFKFEVGQTEQELIDIAYGSLEKNDGDYVIANDKTQIVKEDRHIAYLIDKDKDYMMCDGKLDISHKLLLTLNKA